MCRARNQLMRRIQEYSRDQQQLQSLIMEMRVQEGILMEDLQWVRQSL